MTIEASPVCMSAIITCTRQAASRNLAILDPLHQSLIRLGPLTKNCLENGINSIPANNGLFPGALISARNNRHQEWKKPRTSPGTKACFLAPL